MQEGAKSYATQLQEHIKTAKETAAKNKEQIKQDAKNRKTAPTSPRAEEPKDGEAKAEPTEAQATAVTAGPDDKDLENDALNKARAKVTAGAAPAQPPAA